MTFGVPPVQGFTRKPSTPWFNDDGGFAGIIHQERNLTYVLFNGAGHMVPQYQPANVGSLHKLKITSLIITLCEGTCVLKGICSGIE